MAQESSVIVEELSEDAMIDENTPVQRNGRVIEPADDELHATRRKTPMCVHHILWDECDASRRPAAISDVEQQRPTEPMDMTMQNLTLHSHHDRDVLSKSTNHDRQKGVKRKSAEFPALLMQQEQDLSPAKRAKVS